MYYYVNGKKVKYNPAENQGRQVQKPVSTENYKSFNSRHKNSCKCSKWMSTLLIIVVIFIIIWLAYLMYKKRSEKESE